MRIVYVADVPQPENFDEDNFQSVWIDANQYEGCPIERLIATAKRMRPDIIRVIENGSVEDIVEWDGM